MDAVNMGYPGANFCEEAFLAQMNDQPLDPAHVAACPVCIRHQRMEEAQAVRAEPLGNDAFYDLLDPMADEYIGKPSGIDTLTAQRFYAAMVKDQQKEDFFAACVDALFNPLSFNFSDEATDLESMDRSS